MKMIRDAFLVSGIDDLSGYPFDWVISVCFFLIGWKTSLWCIGSAKEGDGRGTDGLSIRRESCDRYERYTVLPGPGAGIPSRLARQGDMAAAVENGLGDETGLLREFHADQRGNIRECPFSDLFNRSTGKVDSHQGGTFKRLILNGLQGSRKFECRGRGVVLCLSGDMVKLREWGIVLVGNQVAETGKNIAQRCFISGFRVGEGKHHEHTGQQKKHDEQFDSAHFLSHDVHLLSYPPEDMVWLVYLLLTSHFPKYSYIHFPYSNFLLEFVCCFHLFALVFSSS